MTVTLAALAIACFIVGNDATIRASLVTTPSFTGTFRSARINTRLFEKSNPAIERILGVCITPITYILIKWAADHRPITRLVAVTTAAAVMPQASMAKSPGADKP